MGQLGELFPGAPKLRQESDEDDGTGQRFQPGPLDLDSGVVRLAPKAKPAARPTDEEEG
ncbi:MAG TPA: hypothetical protein VHW44_12695 [Pseudonocardiaceae bacterium]|jgi:hypothetical protein|nr:hypothetical protein [Pseudonocardiaceae bacterium]